MFPSQSRAILNFAFATTILIAATCLTVADEVSTPTLEDVEDDAILVQISEAGTVELLSLNMEESSGTVPPASLLVWKPEDGNERWTVLKAGGAWPDGLGLVDLISRNALASGFCCKYTANLTGASALRLMKRLNQHPVWIRGRSLLGQPMFGAVTSAALVVFLTPGRCWPRFSSNPWREALSSADLDLSHRWTARKFSDRVQRFVDPLKMERSRLALRYSRVEVRRKSCCEFLSPRDSGA